MYVTESTFRSLSLVPPRHLDEIAAESPEFLSGHLEQASEYVDSRLRKRYACPFASPAPRIVQRWVIRLVTRECFLRRGIDPTDAQWQSIEAQATQAETEIKEAADATDGLFDLPLANDSSSPSTAGPVPLSYTERSPYVWRDRQAQGGREDDSNGTGKRRG